MTVMWKWIRRLPVIILIVGLVPILYISGGELWVYATRDFDKAKATAQKTFMRVCQKESLDPQTFVGPRQIVDYANAYYAFEWNVRGHEDETITISISYLPYDVGYTMSVSLIQRNSQSPFDRR
jgi:hypothetical protein